MIPRILVTVVLLLLAAAPATPALADEYKIGVINIERIMRDAPLAKARSAALEQEFKARDEALAARERTLVDQRAAYEKERPGLTEEQRIHRGHDLEAQALELVRQRQQLAESLRTRQFEELDRLKERMDQVLTRIAREEKFDLILQNALYAGKALDITDLVIKSLPAP